MDLWERAWPFGGIFRRFGTMKAHSILRCGSKGGKICQSISCMKQSNNPKEAPKFSSPQLLFCNPQKDGEKSVFPGCELDDIYSTSYVISFHYFIISSFLTVLFRGVLYIYRDHNDHMVVSINRRSPKWIVFKDSLNWKNLLKWMITKGTPLLGNLWKAPTSDFRCGGLPQDEAEMTELEKAALGFFVPLPLGRNHLATLGMI